MAASVATDINNQSYSIIDEANLPARPAFPDRLQIVLMGLGAGLFLGLAAVAGREYLDPTLGSEHEASMVLNIPVLIAIPEIPAHTRAGRKLLVKKAS
jgi:succinoglycan biosynthesis transport protein ExoP